TGIEAQGPTNSLKVTMQQLPHLTFKTGSEPPLHRRERLPPTEFMRRPKDSDCKDAQRVGIWLRRLRVPQEEERAGPALPQLAGLGSVGAAPREKQGLPPGVVSPPREARKELVLPQHRRSDRMERWCDGRSQAAVMHHEEVTCQGRDWHSKGSWGLSRGDCGAAWTSALKRESLWTVLLMLLKDLLFQQPHLSH
ncbi:hypothetical protein MJG53_005535, partial [Ovis ammon polii x Ovis aries]